MKTVRWQNPEQEIKEPMRTLGFTLRLDNHIIKYNRSIFMRAGISKPYNKGLK